MVLIIFNQEIIPFEFAGLNSDNKTFGHLFLSDNSFTVENFEDYKKKLLANFVVLDSSERKEIIISQIKAICKKINCSVVDNLENEIKDMVWKGKAPGASFIGVSNERQLDILRRSVSDINEAINAHKNRVSMDCISVYVRSSIESLGEITGNTITDEALDKIFSEFCIGK